MKRNFIILLIASLSLAACSKDYLETAPTASVAEKDLFTTLTGAQTLLDGIHRYTYYYGGAHDKFGQKAIDYIMDCLGEDFYPTERGYGWFVSWYQYIEHRNINSANVEYVWAYYYDIIQNANLILANIDNIQVVDAQIPLKNNIKAQALTYRAFSHYMLVQLYGDRYDFNAGAANSHPGVPIKLVPDAEPLPRSTVAQVYTQVKKDLTDALALLANSSARVNMSHININVTNAIAARVALTTGDWANAVTYAKAARAGRTLEADYTYGWNKSSTEWIWGALLIDEQQTSYASFFSHIDPNFGGYAALGNHKLISTSVYDFMSNTDVRKSLFKPVGAKPLVGFKFTGFGNWTNDYLYIKAGEMYLIEAEAEARRNNFTAAQDALFSLISKRDPAYVKSTLTGEALIDHILMHRRADLWGDGQRFLDIKRLNKGMDRRNLGHNPAQWNAASNFPAGDKNFVFLIPKQEIDANPNMTQNPL
ncbi:MAG: RagB/SusD family nutrient uptake outer membrane protein [Bacteroidales bacterium]